MFDWIGNAAKSIGNHFFRHKKKYIAAVTLPTVLFAGSIFIFGAAVVGGVISSYTGLSIDPGIITHLGYGACTVGVPGVISSTWLNGYVVGEIRTEQRFRTAEAQRSDMRERQSRNRVTNQQGIEVLESTHMNRETLTKNLEISKKDRESDKRKETLNAQVQESEQSPRSNRTVYSCDFNSFFRPPPMPAANAEEGPSTVHNMSSSH